MELKNLSHSEIVAKIKASGYFKIQEFVDKTTYDKYGERAWRYIDRRLLITMYFIRDIAQASFTANNWSSGGKFSQRGLRTNICSIVKGKTDANKLYLSGHVLGCALDFDVKGMKASEVREWLVSIADELPFKIRLENKMKGKQISWVHIDMYDEDKNPMVYLFNV